ncbi:PREDICTED: uncharacterized protein LOC109462206 [Branchiostoma belcheri]|uniref:Uncharacterized protein LOC109462206 n=1 Tax=Branchiostoma belcheri TaxID=7741 RepID=A0A6P4XCM8_BRABE|nr:PREDICTED: uncharacterized protein LOC109462206 [Branchiostoma belcheri]XP_019614291.1 PREDICTED: uncharacterized protein LOC109462206 [Branchiostoma belcheri]XP_019614292.1 PREDICTED: uncharacterized protein LOC109462206 [Branchiostoma belcheri]
MPGRKAGSTSLEEELPSPVSVPVGLVLALTLPVSLAVLWKFSLPLLAVSVLGEEAVQRVTDVAFDLAAHFTSPCPVWIPHAERRWLQQPSDRQIRRVSNISRREFVMVVNRGEPVIITDAMQGWESLNRFDCDYFIKTYPTAEYFDWQKGHKIRFGDIPTVYGGDPDSWKCASGYFDTFWDTNMKAAVDWLAQVPEPYFLPEGSLTASTAGHVRAPMMTGFLGTPGTGVSPHLDETCETFMTVQFSGVKNWSLSWPEVHDGKLRWSPPMVFTLNPGEIMLWYVGMRHHTEVVSGCSLSFSYRFSTPAPMNYFEKLRNALQSFPQEEIRKLFAETKAMDVDYAEHCEVNRHGDRVHLS